MSRFAIKRATLRTVCLMAAIVAQSSLTPLRASTRADESGPVGPDRQQYQSTVDRAIRYLTMAQADDGSIGAHIGIGPTALATLGLLRSGRTESDPQVEKALNYLQEYVQENGGVYTPGGRISTYETCIALVCLQAANGSGTYDEIIRKGNEFIRTGQWDESRDKDKSDLYYGGTGYGGNSRPDLSNTAFFVETLRTCGAAADDESIQKALVFISRCQNLEGEHNTTQFAAKVNDGGFYYTCVVGGGPGEERQTANGGLRSYGSMTYSGLKSMIYAGLTKEDPRVKAATDWIRKNYDVSTNPGMGDAGLYYYYHTFAKSLDALGIDQLEDAAGVKHDWRRELTAELARRQQQDGSWANENIRWMEGDPNLATAFALLALSYCAPKSDAPNSDK